MNQTRSHHLLPVMLISTNACLPHLLAISNEEKDREDLRQTSERGDNEGIL